MVETRLCLSKQNNNKTKHVKAMEKKRNCQMMNKTK